ncbi:MAG: hypothetical protein P0111_15755 [Nitrospira sp.]|nr:hypothetical protein [Nitrospira sp.]
MTQDTSKGLAVIRRQLQELEQIEQETMGTLNTTAGTERVAKWRVKTIALLTDSLGQNVGQDFAKIQPGPSFSNDLVEEFGDLIECFRGPLTALSKTTAQAAQRQAGGG